MRAQRGVSSLYAQSVTMSELSFLGVSYVLLSHIAKIRNFMSTPPYVIQKNGVNIASPSLSLSRTPGQQSGSATALKEIPGSHHNNIFCRTYMKGDLTSIVF